MTQVVRHLFHYRSPLDDQDQPYVVSAPSEMPATGRLPVIFFLHDTLPEASAGAFTETALREAARWQTILTGARPALLVQPFGRGNAGWIGAGGRDLFDVWKQLAQQFPIEPTAGLLGVGGGATGALLLGCWFPERFSAIAACGAWTDDRLDLPLGAVNWPAWERAQRRALAPRPLAGNLHGLPLHFEHAWWQDGLEGTAPRAHLMSMLEKLENEGISYSSADSVGALVLRREAPADPIRLLNWLLDSPRTPEHRRRRKAFCLRAAQSDWLRLLRLDEPGRAGTIETKARNGSMKVKTSGIGALALRIGASNSPRAMRIDGQRLRLPEPAASGNGEWVYLERLARGWAVLDPQGEQPTKRPELAGPPLDLRWDAVSFVPGTLGDEVENHANIRLAQALAERWRTGADSPNPHPGDRAVAMEYPVVMDVDLREEVVRRRHLVAIGNPRTNLLLARLRGRLPCRWDDAGNGRFIVSIGGRSYSDSRDCLILLCPNPEAPDRYLLLMTSAGSQGLVEAARVQTAFMPDFLVLRGPRVLDWGYLAPNWAEPATVHRV